MKRNRRNSKREKRRRRSAAGEGTNRELYADSGKRTPKRAKIVSPVEQDRRRRRDARSEIPAEIREIADEMGVVLPGEKAAQAREQGGSDGR